MNTIKKRIINLLGLKDKLFLKRRLDKERKEIEKQIKRLGKVPDFGKDIDSGEEKADETEDFGNRLAIREELKQRREEILNALSKIKEGKYGFCEKCKQKISPELLKIEAASKFCQECKQEMQK